MKIVSVITSGTAGGAEFASQWLLDAMAERGHETVQLTDVPALAEGAPTRRVEIDLGPKLSLRSYARLGATWPLLARRLRSLLEREAPYDVLLVHFKKEQLLVPALPRALRPTTVWAEWGPVPYQMRMGPGGRAYAAAGRRADLVVAVSEHTRESVCTAGVDPEKVAVLPNAIATDRLRFRPEGREAVRGELGIPAGAFVVGCVSRLHPKKRNDVIVEAVKLLGPDVHLIVAGEGECEADLRERAAPLGERAHFIETPGERMADVVSAFDVSAFGPSPTEGHPLAVIASMLVERPCLSTGPEGVEDLIDDRTGGIASPIDDPAALARLIEERAADPEGAREAGRLARERARARFDAAIVAARFEELIEAARSGATDPASLGLRDAAGR
jgi:glycosyltransferase involved in cell wall biosynthesis